eukprot:63562-Lingulodinium_polyedra.AAC.1
MRAAMRAQPSYNTKLQPSYNTHSNTFQYPDQRVIARRLHATSGALVKRGIELRVARGASWELQDVPQVWHS